MLKPSSHGQQVVRQNAYRHLLLRELAAVGPELLCDACVRSVELFIARVRMLCAQALHFHDSVIKIVPQAIVLAVRSVQSVLDLVFRPLIRQA